MSERPPIRSIIGAGSQGRVVLEMWRAQHPSTTFRFVDDDAALQGTHVVGVLVEPGDSLAHEDEAVIAVGNNPLRLQLAERWQGRLRWGIVRHPSSVVVATAQVGEGTVVFAGAILNSQARVGRHVIVNSGVIIEHDCVVGDGVALGPGVAMGGRVEIGRGAFVSTGVTLAPRVRVGAGTVVGAGAVVVSDLPANVLAFGTPARVVRSIDGSFDWKRLL